MMRVDLFCRVIDNWGDAGVCWRLARQWVHEYDAQVRLWIDQPQVLAAWQNECADQHALQICAWNDAVNWSVITPAQVVIEAFACEIPASYIHNMTQRVEKPHWFNLEYLSAESWVEGAHLLPSPQAGGLNKTFFFPGFTERTGGLLRERDLIARRDAFVQAHPQHWSDLTGFAWDDAALKISLFGYEQMPLHAWLPALIAGDEPVQLAVTHGKASDAVRRAWGALPLPHSELPEWCEGRLQVRFLPMLTQDEYDQLLWSADINMVRGEDSLVRALWAGKPLTWDIYKQDDGVHWDKLSAFMQMYTCANPPSDAAQAWMDWQTAWNHSDAPAQQMRQAWHNLRLYRVEIAQMAAETTRNLAAQTDLLTRLSDNLS